MIYTTKIVPECYLLDNEREGYFRGYKKVCEIARFVCGIAHFAQGQMLKKVSFRETFDEKYL